MKTPISDWKERSHKKLELAAEFDDREPAAAFPTPEIVKDLDLDESKAEAVRGGLRFRRWGSISH